MEEFFSKLGKAEEVWILWPLENLNLRRGAFSSSRGVVMGAGIAHSHTVHRWRIEGK